MFSEPFCSLWMQLHAQRSLQKPAFTHYKYHHISVFCVLRSHPLRYVCANCLALKLFYKCQDFWKMLWKKYVSVSPPPILSTDCMKQFSFYYVLSKILLKLHKHLQVNYQLFLSHFSETHSILTDFKRFSLNLIHSNLMKMHPVGAEMFNMDRETIEQPARHDEAHNPSLQFCKCTYTLHFHTDGKIQY